MRSGCKKIVIRIAAIVLTGMFIGLCGYVFSSSAAWAQDDSMDAPSADEPAPPAAPPSSNAPSDSKAPAKSDVKSKSGKRTTIDFEDELIEGKTQKPELFYLLQKRQFNYKRMIRLRENFLPEMRKTSEDMQRKGSSD